MTTTEYPMTAADCEVATRSETPVSHTRAVLEAILYANYPVALL
ncbi:hypothetical protein MB901379_00168 [Mycobacterium basiliense]|uniref:Uncharacterized protein n=1 Tax=Mycobacterium basiliense TaxID=2094119 RepID=A0A3S4BC45_9MYCO|nr:hypothetical protein [Mycobacterium basiliense]VDM86646.1 hypothetical protein MB901379_00168 [Mycobacterium basiliense]